VKFQNGWVKLHRSLLKSDLVHNANLFCVWSWVLLNANYEETKILWKGEQRALPKGALLFTPMQPAEIFGLTRRTVQKWLQHLHDTGRIVLESSSRGSLLTVCNWDTYQIEVREGSQPGSNQVAAGSQPSSSQVALIEEGKKEEGKKVSRAKHSSSHPIIPELQNPATDILLQAVTEAQQRAWLETSPDPDWLKEELRKARNYLSTKPSRRFTARFFTAWLNRADVGVRVPKNHGGGGPAQPLFVIPSSVRNAEYDDEGNLVG
jgi:hypothetical protein